MLEPWVLAVNADDSTAEERQQLAELLAVRTDGRLDRVLLSTCHRVELYGFGEPDQPASQLGARQGAAAVEHLLRVAAGLESAIVGEDEVLHQVRDALRAATAAHALDHRLRRLFEVATAAGRRARAGRTASSAGLAGRAVSWLGERRRLAGQTVVVAGAGRMGSALAHAASGAGARVTVASRDVRKARRLAAVYGGSGVDLAAGAELAETSAGVAVALAGVWKELARPRTLPPIADISAPSAVPAEVRAGLNGSFLGIDDLFTGRLAPPRGYVEAAEGVVAAKTAEYVAWLESRR
jgi:glutamyl-tRNA reductase